MTFWKILVRIFTNHRTFFYRNVIFANNCRRQCLHFLLNKFSKIHKFWEKCILKAFWVSQKTLGRDKILQIGRYAFIINPISISRTKFHLISFFFFRKEPFLWQIDLYDHYLIFLNVNVIILHKKTKNSMNYEN